MAKLTIDEMEQEAARLDMEADYQKRLMDAASEAGRQASVNLHRIQGAASYLRGKAAEMKASNGQGSTPEDGEKDDTKEESPDGSQEPVEQDQEA
jgi:hypothetical protein